MEPPSQGIFRYFPLRKAHFFTPPLPFPTSLRNSWAGPGGVGKTHLGITVARDLLPDFANGVYFVPLAAISDPGFVLPAIAQALGLREADSRSRLFELQEAIGDQSLLLLLDNFEQVLSAAQGLSQLLPACPR